ncbi:hypothetical protein OHS17_00780 [Streptomyces sp. NBC_00523]|uniref:hypothetical protein n=1 Tax=Streptomyces sp. NBC_00523 TaxID=2975765 RepID=UPI002E80EC04|nr:hypothetical protein [Streptomyces sp. NBC_00523]WUC98284.1 hypothetical protein OHS17_00780 [Streptomyces sp. NBC_00523]
MPSQLYFAISTSPSTTTRQTYDVTLGHCAPRTTSFSGHLFVAARVMISCVAADSAAASNVLVSVVMVTAVSL